MESSPAAAKEQKDAPQPAGNTSARATELPAGETITGSIQTDSLALVDLYKSLDGMELVALQTLE